jgi:hypothetical protein
MRYSVIYYQNISVTLLAKQYRFISTKELVLRNSPRVEDKYIYWMSRRESHAVFGNILSKYISPTSLGAPGTVSGTVISEHKDSNNVKWAYVTVDEISHAFRYYNPYSVNVGWVEVNSILKNK